MKMTVIIIWIYVTLSFLLPCHLAFLIRLQQTHTIWGGKQENCQNKSGGLSGNEVLKAECISYVIESLLPTGNWESLSTFWFFLHFCTSNVRIPMNFSIKTWIFQAHQLCIIQFVDWKVLNRTIIGKKESIGFLYSRFGCVCGSTTWANFANSKNLPKDRWNKS